MDILVTFLYDNYNSDVKSPNKRRKIINSFGCFK